MKKVIGMALAMAAAVCFGEAQNDLRVTFSTTGKDCYKDGTTVLDGEFYALVWSAGEFGGFAADGSAVSSADKVLATVPFAKDGKLGFTKFLIPAAEKADYATGSFSVILLDTRKADGTLAEPVVVDGMRVPAAVNGWVATATVGVAEAAASASLGVASPVAIASASALPEDAPTPVITGVRKEGDFLILTVKGTAAYLRYNVAGGATPDAIGTVGTAEDPKDGAASTEDTIELKVPAKGESGFYKVIRN
ncbi:MAG: hypothetical protein K6F50_05020 [Kiritimatiellae bacterium]|nr:hypothetical protein [Kiritimatiellia bacterium]